MCICVQLFPVVRTAYIGTDAAGIADVHATLKATSKLLGKPAGLDSELDHDSDGNTRTKGPKAKIPKKKPRPVSDSSSEDSED